MIVNAFKKSEDYTSQFVKLLWCFKLTATYTVGLKCNNQNFGVVITPISRLVPMKANSSGNYGPPSRDF